VATEAAWLNGKKREELMERAKKLLTTWIGLLMEGIGRIALKITTQVVMCPQMCPLE
jgi:hypothetical protein